MRRVQFLVSALLLFLLVAACAPQAAPVPAPQTPVAAVGAPAPAATAAPAKAAWEVEWEKTLEAAKKEGRLAIITGLDISITTPISQAFKKAYGIALESVVGRGAEIGAKILAERRAGIYSYDIYAGGSTTGLNQLKPAGALDSMEPALVLPDVTDPELIKKVWWPERLWWVDADHTILAPALRIGRPININTDLVKEGEIKSYRDLLNPKWQGKFILNDTSIAGTGATFAAYIVNTLGWDYLVELAKAKPIIMRDERIMVEWVARGKVPLVVAPNWFVTAEFIRVGAPLKVVIPQEGTWLVGGITNLTLLNRAPHPSAAKVFINWYLTKEGQTIVARAASAQSARLDVPTDHLVPDETRQPGGKYFVIDTEGVALSQPEYMKKCKEIFGPLMQ